MNSTLPEREVRMVFRGQVAEFMADQTRLIDLEGAFRCGKTTAALWKVYQSCIDHPGIAWLICRYSDGDTQTKIKPQWRDILASTGTVVKWDSGAQCDVFPNGPNPADPYTKGSRVYVFGIKAQDQVSRYGKLRGLTLSGIYNDQTEEVPEDVFREFMGRLSQSGFPHQLILTPNPPDPNHWLCIAFPEDNHITGRKYYSVPIYANAGNLSEDVITHLEQAYPLSHPKHGPAVLGKRGLSVRGRPVYGGDPEQGLMPAFQRAIHVRALAMNPQLPLLEALDFGLHHPCVVWAQYSPHGGVAYLGGVIGQDLYLEDFLPMIQQVRTEWFPKPLEVLTCCDPAGSHNNSQGVRANGVQLMREYGFAPRWKENSNAPDVRRATIERIASYLRKRTAIGEALAVDATRWRLVSPAAVKSWPFLADGFEAGYVWDENDVSVGSKKVSRPKKDGWYEHGMNCIEYLELNFGGTQPSVQDVMRHAQRTARLQTRDVDEFDYQVRAARRRAGMGRGGYS